MTAVPRHHDLAGLGGSRGDRAVERRDDTEIRSVGAGLFELSTRARGLRLRGGDVGLCLQNLPLHGHDLGGANGRVHEIRLRRRQRAARRFDLTPLRGDDRRLRLLVVLGSLGLLLGDQPFLEQTRHSLPVPLRLRMRGLGLGELRLCGGQPSLRLVDAAFGIGARLIHAEPALPELFLEHGDLMLGQTRTRLGLPDRGGRLVLTRAHLLVIEHGDHLTGLDAIAFPNGDLADPPGALGGDGRVIAFDPSAHRDHTWRNGWRSEEETPDGKRDEAHDDRRRDHHERTPGPDHAR